MWYSGLYRRHLCDMHIDDWDESFLSEFSPEEYIENLKRAHINYAMLYYQSHVGLCYYPTKTGVMHKAFIGQEDKMRRLVDLCHQNGIKVAGYYSITHNTMEHDRHPDWRMLKPNGISLREGGEGYVQTLDFASLKYGRYGQCCPNNPDYTAFTYEQIDEMLDYFDSDALFFDMPFWQYTCYCQHCRARWEKEVGGEMPVDPKPDSKEYDLLTERKYEWMGEWIRKLTDYVKSKSPDLPVEHNYASAIAGNSGNGCGEAVGAASDYVGGDLYGGAAEHSFTCKFYRNATNHQPFEYMFSRCKPALRVHTLTKTVEEMKSSIAITMAHHGATLVIDAIDPVGTMDARVYDRFAQMFDYEMPYEPYFRGEMVEDIGIYYGVRSKTGRYGDENGSVTACVCTANTLTRRHIPFGVTGNWHDLSRYPILIAPVLSAMEEKDDPRLADYVRSGGTLYISGCGNRKLVEELTGGRIVRDRTPSDKVYLAPTAAYQECFGWFTPKYPLPFDGFAPMIEGIAPEHVAATLTLPYTGYDEMRYASIHSDPPGVATDTPMVVVKPYGKGMVIWSAVPLEAVAYEEYRDILLNLLRHAHGSVPTTLQSTAPTDVELTLFRSEGEWLVHAFTLCDEGISPKRPAFSVTVKTGCAPKRVTLLPQGTPIPFAYRDGTTTFETRELHIHDLYRIEM